MIITLLFPILRRRIIWPTMIGVGLTMVGTIMNRIVIYANNGKMPVYPTVSKWIGYYKEGQCFIPYQKVMTFEEAFEEIRRCKGSHFDPELAEIFISAVSSSYM